MFIRHRIRYWNLIAFCGWQNQRSSGIFTKTLPAIIIGKRKINYGSYYVVEFNLARLAQLDPEGTERYLLENGLDQKEFKAD